MLTLVYVLLMAAYSRGWAMQPEFILPPGYTPVTFISVVVPARNEEATIGPCISSILAQHYPAHLFEIIVVDDHSDDATAGIVTGIRDTKVRYLSLAEHMEPGKTINAYKKAALTAGINCSNGTLIVTTDADCTASPDWLMHIAAIFERDQPKMIVAPVIYTSDGSILHNFQLTDFMSMQGITAAAHKLNLGNMSNGANLAFSKAAFQKAGGYEGIDHLASGDDYLLMMKLSNAAPGGIAYLKSAKAIVTTTPQPDWISFLRQRIRWASKSGKYQDSRLTAILLLVYLFNLSFLVLVILSLFSPWLLGLLAAMLVTKIMAEYIFLVPVAVYFKRTKVLRYFAILQPLHIAYIILAGFMGFMGGYKWKGRTVK